MADQQEEDLAVMDPPSSRRFLLLLRGIKRAGDVGDEMRSKRVLVFLRFVRILKKRKKFKKGCFFADC
jgi:hypothetical protein